MDASRQNSPSRKSRFRSQPGALRPAESAGEPVPGTEEEAPVYADEEFAADAPPTEAEGLPAAAAPGIVPAGADLSGAYPADAPQEGEGLAAGLRLTRSADDLPTRTRGLPVWASVLASLLCLAVGGALGYGLHPGTTGAASLAASDADTARAMPVQPLAPAVQADVDAAFEAMKQGQFADARARFGALADKHAGWSSMRVESARAALYQHDFEGVQSTLLALLRTGPNVDGEFLTGLLNMTMQDYEKAETAFGRAVALDPARPDVFYFWGECLRREGKPQDAADKFREAVMRNQYETAEGLYQLKLWLSEIQADQEAAKGSSAKIDADLASGHPSGAALFAAAAREIKAGKFKEAGDHVGQAQKVMEPAVFRVILQDPTFLQENYRPELERFYKP